MVYLNSISSFELLFSILCVTFTVPIDRADGEDVMCTLLIDAECVFTFWFDRNAKLKEGGGEENKFKKYLRCLIINGLRDWNLKWDL